MIRNTTSSELFKSIGYKPLENYLEIEFRNGDIICYKPVPNDLYNKFINSNILREQFFNENIKNKFNPIRLK